MTVRIFRGEEGLSDYENVQVIHPTLYTHPDGMVTYAYRLYFVDGSKIVIPDAIRFWVTA